MEFIKRHEVLPAVVLTRRLAGEISAINAPAFREVCAGPFEYSGSIASASVITSGSTAVPLFLSFPILPLFLPVSFWPFLRYAGGHCANSSQMRYRVE